MPILKPESATYHRKRGTSTLTFAEKETPSVECIMRGGICWPVSIREGNQERIEGYAIMVGKDISSGVVTVYEEQVFYSVDHITDSEGRIKYKGLAPWLNNCWTSYFCRIFYWRDRSATYERYMREMMTSAMVQPKPRLVDCIWDDTSEVDHSIASLVHRGQLVIDKDSEFLSQQRAYLNNPTQIYPARHAMLCAVAGMDQFPWRRERQDYD